MKRAFTLIELLVVIAIIAILAAILFPVFAQAKLAAKRTAALSNIKQSGTSVHIYMADYDDVMPRNDGCSNLLMNSSLAGAVPFPPNGVGPGCTSSAGTYGFLYRNNHFRWQTWVLPYMKNTQIFFLPTHELNATAWGQDNITNQFGINTGLTGALNTWPNPNANGAFRNSWLGGSHTAIPRPSEAMLFMEIGALNVPHITHATVDPFVNVQVTYPVAYREFWRYRLMKGTAADCVAGTSGTEPDPRKTGGGMVIIGRADSSAKALAAADFLSKTPTYAQFGATVTFPGYNTANCTLTNGNIGIGTAPAAASQDWPMWGFGN